MLAVPLRSERAAWPCSRGHNNYRRLTITLTSLLDKGGLPLNHRLKYLGFHGLFMTRSICEKRRE